METLSLTLMEDASPTEKHLHFECPYPKMALASEVVAFFDGCDIHCTITVGDESCDMHLSSGSNRIEMEECGQDIVIDLYLNYEEGEKANIRHMSISCMDMSPVAINPEDIEFRNKLVQGFAMGIDFGYAINTAQGLDVCFEKRVQIKTPEEAIITIDAASENFVWRDNTLLCRLPIGIKHFVRIQYESTNGWVDWSPWKEFVCRRKMSL